MPNVDIDPLFYHQHFKLLIFHAFVFELLKHFTNGSSIPIFINYFKFLDCFVATIILYFIPYTP